MPEDLTDLATPCASACSKPARPTLKPDTPELDMALALSECIGAMVTAEMDPTKAREALWRWRQARGMNDWPKVDGGATTDDVLEAEVVSG